MVPIVLDHGFRSVFILNDSLRMFAVSAFLVDSGGGVLSACGIGKTGDQACCHEGTEHELHLYFSAKCGLETVVR